MTPVTGKPFERLGSATLGRAGPDVRLFDYDRGALATGIVHFGPGAFHRAHQAYFVDRLLRADPRWAICDVALRGTSITEALAAQDGLYTIAELGGHPTYRVVGSVREAMSARSFPQTVLARLAAAATQIVTLTVTENGYCLTPGGDLDTARAEIAHDLSRPKNPTSAIGWLVEGLAQRRRAGIAPYTMTSCDNLAANGARLKRAVLQFAAAVEPELARWIEGEARFPSTMVDSITPATDEALKARVAVHLGAFDRVPVQREPFVQWVMEDLPGMAGPDWAAAGVTLSCDVAGYENAKLRLLNGAHSTLAYLGLLRGRRTTRDAMDDAALASFVGALLREDIAPTLTPPAGLDLHAYIDSVLARIANPAIAHHLGQIAWDGSQKLPYRLFATIESALAARRPLARLAVPIAAWMRFVRRRARDKIELIDPLAPRVLEIGAACTGEGVGDTMLFLSLDGVFPRALASNGTFTLALAEAYDAIGDSGTLPGDGW
ncbi:MAG: mannitol dehydrogenase family protein [Rhizomicrobium sp.]